MSLTKEERVIYVPNMPMRFDKATGKFRPLVDITPAREHASTVRVLSEGAITTEELPERIREMQSTALMQMRPDDYILCLGDLVLVATLIANVQILMGAASLLRWDRHTKRYNVVTVEPMCYETTAVEVLNDE